MASPPFIEVLELAQKLTPDDQLRLIAHLANTARLAYTAPEPRPKWMDIRGTAPYPALGEDAQAWVSRTRQESDEACERQWREAP